MTPPVPSVLTLDAERSVEVLLRWIGEDPARPGLRETPARVARAFREMTAGYGTDPASFLKVFDEPSDGMVVLRRVGFTSLCEHHLLPFCGTATVGYIADGRRVVGLSKLARLVDCYAHRLQVQERMTKEIASALQRHLRPVGVGVVVRATHQCMTCRGIRKHGPEMVTCELLGQIRENPQARAEFLGFDRG